MLSYVAGSSRVEEGYRRRERDTEEDFSWLSFYTLANPSVRETKTLPIAQEAFSYCYAETLALPLPVSGDKAGDSGAA